MLEQKIAKIDCDTDTFLRELRLNVLVHRELCSKTDCVVAIDSKRRRPEEYLVRFRVWNYCIRLQEIARPFANQFSEESPVPFVWWPAPLCRTVPIHEAVVEHVGALAAVVLKKLRERTTKPQVVAE